MSDNLSRATSPFFTNEEMVSILDLDADYLTDEGHQKKLENLSLSASDFLYARTGHDWANDGIKDPTASDCASLWIKMRFYADTNYSKEYDFSLGIQADLNDLIGKAS
jgi:hypothetical protein